MSSWKRQNLATGFTDISEPKWQYRCALCLSDGTHTVVLSDSPYHGQCYLHHEWWLFFVLSESQLLRSSPFSAAQQNKTSQINNDNSTTTNNINNRPNNNNAVFREHFKNGIMKPGSIHHSVDLRIQTYTCMEPVPLKYVKLATKYPWIYGYFITVNVKLYERTFS